VDGGNIVGVEPDPGHPVSEGELCLKGYYGYRHVRDPHRLRTPLIRKRGVLSPVSWQEVLGYLAEHLQEIRRQNPDAFALWASAKATNEDNYVAQKFARVVMGTNNIDHCARLCHAPTVAGLAAALGSGVMTNSIAEIGTDTETILVIGSNTAECHPLVARHIIKAQARGAKLIVVDPRRTEMAARADIWLRVPVGQNISLLNGMMHVIVRDGLVDPVSVRERADGFDTLVTRLAAWTPARVQERTGVPQEDLEAAAHLYAGARTAVIIYGMGVTQFSHGTAGVLALANLAVITGHLGRPGAGLLPLRGQNNVQGACDMGCLPNSLPGYLDIAGAATLERCERVWETKPPATPGLKATEVSEAILQGKVRALYIAGENPVMSGPDTEYFRRALEQVELLVVQDIFLTETARLATVVLPAACAAEKDGTFTNTERRVQRVRQAVPPPGQARPDWWIFAELARQMGGTGFCYRSAEEIWDEVRRLVPEKFGGISYQRLDDGPGICWPCPRDDHPGTPILYEGGVFLTPSGKARLHPPAVDPEQVPDGAGWAGLCVKDGFLETTGGIVEKPDAAYPFVLTTGRRVYHFHTGTMTRRAWVLNQIGPKELVEINPVDARRQGIHNGDLVRVTTRRGQVTARAWVTDRVPAGTIFMTFHFWEACVNELTGRAYDAVCGIPEFKAAAAAVEKISSLEARTIRRQKKERYLVHLETQVNREA
jgi:formate dehydrogenase major subunit